MEFKDIDELSHLIYTMVWGMVDNYDYSIEGRTITRDDMVAALDDAADRLR